jgi:hypothetical protein
MAGLKYKFLYSVGPYLTAGSLKLLRRTLKFEYRNDDRIAELCKQGARFVLSFWHENIPMGAFAARHMMDLGVGYCATLTSLSQDGEYLTRTCHQFGIETVRGSSTRGGRDALKVLEQYIETRGHVGVAVDGPRGPRHKSKLGVAIVAKDTGAMILPLSIQYSNAWRLGSWDKSAIPKPFSKCIFTFHEPFVVSRKAGREELEAACARLDAALLQGEPNDESTAADSRQDARAPDSN